VYLLNEHGYEVLDFDQICLNRILFFYF
jgi:hypothetical protein